MIVEAAVDTFEDALAADAEGVDRIELCGPLHNGGTTPDPALVARVLDRVRVPVHVLIRSRAGNFVFGAAEVAEMTRSIGAVKALGAAGVVIGGLTQHGAIDAAAMDEWLSAAHTLRVVMHRAFDELRDQFGALDWLAARGVTAVLTTGAAPTALEGAARLRTLVEYAGDRIGILAAGSITAANVRDLIKRTGVTQVHGRAFRGLPGALRR